MAKNCPKCNFLNPYGAQICGECGHLIMSPKTVEQVKGLSHPRAPSGISLKSIGLEKADLGARLSLTAVLALSLFIYGFIIILLSVLKWFKPADGLHFILLPAHIYPLLLEAF